MAPLICIRKYSKSGKFHDFFVSRFYSNILLILIEKFSYISYETNNESFFCIKMYLYKCMALVVTVDKQNPEFSEKTLNIEVIRLFIQILA